MITSTLIKFDIAKQALAEARNIDEVKLVRDQAEALRLYVRQQGDSLEMQNDIAEIKLRAERRAGELLAEMDVKPGNPQLLHDGTIASPRLDELGISRIQSHRWQTEASVPAEVFERHVAKTKAAKEELTSIGLYRLAQRLKQKRECEQTKNNTLAFSTNSKKYRALIIDPPWPTQKILRDKRPRQDIFDYPTMIVEEIAKLPITELADSSGCHIYLWATHKFIPVAFQLFEDWGVKYECLMTWRKNVGFTPFSWMYDTEHVLFGRIGSLPLEMRGLRLSFDAPVTRHSKKPDVFYERVLAASPAPRLELFARVVHEGFEAWGDEVECRA